MSGEVDLQQQLSDAVDALAEAGVPHALCGGLALAVHGIARATEDIDLLVPEAELERALAALGSPQRLYRATRPPGTDHVTVDVLVVSPAYASACEGRMCLTWNGRALWVVSREGLVAMKRLSRRMKDLADLERLEGGAHGG